LLSLLLDLRLEAECCSEKSVNFYRLNGVTSRKRYPIQMSEGIPVIQTSLVLQWFP
jgi:hypothetical protein